MYVHRFLASSCTFCISRLIVAALGHCGTCVFSKTGQIAFVSLVCMDFVRSLFSRLHCSFDSVLQVDARDREFLISAVPLLALSFVRGQCENDCSRLLCWFCMLNFCCSAGCYVKQTFLDVSEILCILFPTSEAFGSAKQC